MNNNLDAVNILYENSNGNEPEYIQRRRAMLTRSIAKRNVTRNNKAMRRFSLGNKGNVTALNTNITRKRASLQSPSKNHLRFIKSRRNRK